MSVLRWPRRRALVALAIASAFAGVVADVATPSTHRASKTVPGDLLVFITGNPPLNPSGGELLSFNLPAGKWLLIGEVVAVKSTAIKSSGNTEVVLECELRIPGKAVVDAHVQLPGRGLRNATLQTAVQLAEASNVSVWCRLRPSDPSPTSVKQVVIHALRVRSITLNPV